MQYSFSKLKYETLVKIDNIELKFLSNKGFKCHYVEAEKQNYLKISEKNVD